MAALFLVALPAVALVHQTVRFSEPADQEVVETVPDRLRLTFTEPLRMEFTEVEVEGPAGRLILGELRTAVEEAELHLVPVEAGWHAGGFIALIGMIGAVAFRGAFLLLVGRRGPSPLRASRWLAGGGSGLGGRSRGGPPWRPPSRSPSRDTPWPSPASPDRS